MPRRDVEWGGPEQPVEGGDLPTEPRRSQNQARKRKKNDKRQRGRRRASTAR